MANVVSVQDRGTRATASDRTQPGSRIEKMADLLRRYPKIEEDERTQLLNFLTTGPQEEIVLVTYRPGMEPRYGAFRADHPSDFPSNIKAWIPLIVLVIITVVGVTWRLLS
jgi:hypothetical protein